jgi:hypothetical protein
MNDSWDNSATGNKVVTVRKEICGHSRGGRHRRREPSRSVMVCHEYAMKIPAWM